MLNGTGKARGVGHTWEPSTSYYPKRDRAVTGAIIGKRSEENSFGRPSDSSKGKAGKGARTKSALSKAGGSVIRQALSEQSARESRHQTNMQPHHSMKRSQLSFEQQAVHDLIDPPDSFRENYPPLPVAQEVAHQQDSLTPKENTFVRSIPSVMPADLPKQKMEWRDRRDGHEAGYLGQRALAAAAVGSRRRSGGGGYAQQFQKRKIEKGAQFQGDGNPPTTLDRSRMRKMTYGDQDGTMMKSPHVAVRTRILDVSYR